MASTEKDVEAIETAKSLKNIPWCEDYEKMISGMMYNAQAPPLVQGRFKARQFMHRYNTHFPPDATVESLTQDREAMLRENFGGVGKSPFVEPPVYFDFVGNVRVGDEFYANFGLIILDCAHVTIGNRVMFGPSVSIYTATHETGVQSRRDGLEYARPVVIGDDCWIGGGTSIMPGVKIGKGCTIGAASVVTKDIEDWSVAVGSPARVVRNVDPVPDV
ncbi:hypothetical protein MKZ38_004987 [Zalerion maritima]|uniref:Maltose/galactoside acetyltransferase domain-containing protein n=1 Tax=Zalerion maritima TaxID=339359 RepID=A0AAD5RRI0_9PEZI|nr:hypothetical protein MKZ38_004987 [Zalerion maritima]